MLISSPHEVAAWLRKHVAHGQTIAVPALRLALAKDRGAEATCPLTASIFLRIAAEAAWDEMEAGAALANITPFWRAVDPKSDLAGSCAAGRTGLPTSGRWTWRSVRHVGASLLAHAIAFAIWCEQARLRPPLANTRLGTQHSQAIAA